METNTSINHIHRRSMDRRQKTLRQAKNRVSIPETGITSKEPGILIITSYPPRECGIATYSQDLIKALNNKFNHSFHIRICPLESESEEHTYTDDIKYILNIDQPGAFTQLADAVNADAGIQMVMIQHEFGLFGTHGDEFEQFLDALTKPILVEFHTVLPLPNPLMKARVRHIADIAASVIVMTKSAAQILIHDYDIQHEKIAVIPHGTHLVPHLPKEHLKKKYQITGRQVLSTFGFLSSGKCIETTLNALPDIISRYPDVLFLIIGKTHPSVVKHEGEAYRNMLEAKISELKLNRHVQFINKFLPLPDLLEYLQLTDIYLFTSGDPNQAVSGTFSYAISCGCPVISTPIPHAREVLGKDAGIIIDFKSSQQLGKAVIHLLSDEQKRKNIISNGLHRMASTAWENSAIAHAMLLEHIGADQISLRFNPPSVNLDHVKKLTTPFGMIQFSKINQPDLKSGYTLDDNARAMIAMCHHFELTGDTADVKYINIYFQFIRYCLQANGAFLNYVNEHKEFTAQNQETNLEDANGRAIWALGYLISMGDLLPKELRIDAELLMQKALVNTGEMHSTRAMAFVIKGLYYRNTKIQSIEETSLIRMLADRLLQMYRHEEEEEWRWFESYLTYANSILPEAMLCAWLVTDEPVYLEIAQSSFHFLLSKTLGSGSIQVISNKSWLQKGEQPATTALRGEQPIDVAYTIMALKKFHDVFPDDNYLQKMQTAFNWFLGHNHLHQIIYNPCTGGCYDGLEETCVNLNQGAESTVSYLMARLTIESLAGNAPTNRRHISNPSSFRVPR